MYDVVVVGARCAGASLAMLLARRGHRVALVDRAHFPSDTISSHFLWPRGAARLQAWGLLDSLVGLGCGPLPVLTFDYESVALTGGPEPVNGTAVAFCPRRMVLDQLLVNAAAEAGAELIEDNPVQSLLWTEGRVAGVKSRRGRLEARLVVGADGRNSMVARAVKAETQTWLAPLTFVYYSYWSGLTTDAPAYYLRAGRLILRWPTNDGLTCIYVGSPRSGFRAFREDVEGNFMRSLELIPGLREEVAAGRREEHFRGAADLPNFYRTSFGEGWALAGDAGHHKDPTTGFGMSDALASAELLAEAACSVLEGGRSWDAALSDYQQRRDEATAGCFQLTLNAAALEPLPERTRAYFAAAGADPNEVTRIFGVLGGSTPAEEVFSRGHIDAFLGERVLA
jgi:flavin-dependent dehydrogenase